MRFDTSLARLQGRTASVAGGAGVVRRGVGQWVVGGVGSYRYARTYIVSFGRQTKSGTEIGDGSEGDANSALEKNQGALV